MIRDQQFSASKQQHDPASENSGSSAFHDAQDEDQIGEPFYRFQQLKHSDPRAAIQVFSQFKIALTRRMDSEEVELFPIFEVRVGKYGKKISETMRQEHQQIRDLLNAIEMKLSLADLKTEVEERALEAALVTHNHRETSIVYSALE